MNLDIEVESSEKTQADSWLSWIWPLRIGNWVATLVWITVLGILLCTLAANVHPWFELATHFSFHALWLSGIALGLSLLHRIVWGRKTNGGTPSRFSMFAPKRVRGGTHFVAFIVFLWIVSPWQWLPSSARSKEGPNEGDKSIRVLSWNVWLRNQSEKEVMSLIREADADLVALYEVNPELASRMEELRDSYAESSWTPEWDSGSIVILSRIPGTVFAKINLANVGMKAVEIDIPAWNGKKACRFLALHTKSPTPRHPSRTRDRDRQLANVASWAVKQTGPAAVLGDFNVTPFSPTFRQLLIDGKLQDTRHGFGNHASWPLALGDFGIPIDHVLINSGFQTRLREVVRPSPGSDHSPIFVELGF